MAAAHPITDRSNKLRAFTSRHPELTEALGLWMAERPICEVVYPTESAIFRREMPEFASDAATKMP